MRHTCFLAAGSKTIAVAVTALLFAMSTAGPAAAVLTGDAASVSAPESPAGNSVPAAPPIGASVPFARYYRDQVMSATLGSGAALSSLKIPAGLTPIRLQGTITTTLQRGETAQLTIGHRVIDRTTTSGTSPFVTDLTPADVFTTGSGQSIAVSVQVLSGSTVVCATPADEASVSDLSINFIGDQSAPTTVATFFDASVSRIHVLVPSGSTPAGVDGAAAAGLSAVATLVRRFGLPGTRSATVDLSAGPVVPGVGGASGGGAASDRPADERILRLVPGPDPVVAQLGTLGGIAELTLTGSRAGLAAAVLGLGAADIVLADGPKVAQLAGSTAPGGVTTRTLAALTGSPVLTLAGFGVSSDYVGVGQPVFGGPVGSVSLHLVGVSAVLPAPSQARLSLSWNGYLLASRLLGAGDPIAIDVAVPAALIQRDNALTFRLDASAGSAACAVGGVAPEVDIDATASTVVTSRAQLLPAGFGRFPQNFGGVLTVGFGDGGQPTDGLLAAAGHYVSALQGESSTALSVVGADGRSVVSGPDDASAALLLDPSGAQLATLSAPLRLGTFRQIGGSQVPFGVALPAPFAVLEAFQSSSRDLLVAGAWAPSAGDRSAAVALMAKLAAAADSPVVGAVDPGSGAVGWAALSGDLLVTSEVTAPTLLNSAALAPQAAIIAAGSGVPVWVFAVVGALLLLLLASLFRHRRRAATVEFVRRQADAATAPTPVVVEGAVVEAAAEVVPVAPVIWQVQAVPPAPPAPTSGGQHRPAPEHDAFEHDAGDFRQKDLP